MGKSEREKLLEELAELREAVIVHEVGERRTRIFNDLMRLEIEFCCSRYIERPLKYRKPPSSAAFELWLTDAQILVHCHMQRSTFNYLCDLVGHEDVWDAPLSFRSQCSTRLQIFCALARLSSCDRGSTIGKLVAALNISHGSLLTFAERFIGAILKLEQRFIKWPSAARREQLAEFGATEHGFHGFIGSMDGTHCYFRRSPEFHMFPEAYRDTWHKGGYGFNCLFTADHTGSIIAYLVGWPGGQCDKVLQPVTALSRDPWRFLKKGEQFLFVDSGFARTMWCVPPYCGASGRKPHNSEFNYAMRQARCRIEHVNAMLKARLGSLNAIPIEIGCEEDIERAQRWVRACLVLHNIYLRLKDEWEFECSDSESSSSSSENDDEGEDGEVVDCDGLIFQNAIRDRFLRSQGWIDA
jgi:hypothetical protein